MYTFKTTCRIKISISSICLFFYSLFFLSQTYGQDITLNRKIQLSSKSITVSQMLNELHQHYGISFSYNDKTIPLDKIITLHKAVLELEELLNTLNEDAGIEYQIHNDILILRQKQQMIKFTINGYIEDATNGEKLLGANIYNKNDYSGTTSNTYGYYSITLSGGQVRLVTTYVGYNKSEKEINLKSDTTIHFRLNPVVEIEAITIEGNKKEYSTRSQLSVINVTSKEVKKIPALLGETDVLKSMQLLPGVQSGTEGSSGLVVRGGGIDQNLIILDGVPVYNINHLFGFFSVFNSNAIQDVNLYKSGFPARYGGRVSSVIDIRMKEGNNKSFKGEGSIGLISSKLTLEGPIKNENTSFILSGRRTYLDLLAKPFLTIKKEGQINVYGYYFYDLNLKINHRFSDKSRLFLSTYLGNDIGGYKTKNWDEQNESNTEYELRWGNITTNLRWNYNLNKKLFSNTTLSFSNYRFIIAQNSYSSKDTGQQTEISQNSSKFLNGIYDVSARTDFDFFPNQNHLIKFGTGYINHSFTPYSFTQQSDPGRDTSYKVNIYGQEAFLYFEDDVSLGQKTNVNAGFHYSIFQSGKKNYFHLQPRIAFKYSPTENVALKLSVSKMVQYLQTNSYSAISLPIDLWIPSTDSLLPAEAFHYSFGIDYLNKGKYSLGVEGFYKTIQNTLTFKEGATPGTNLLNDIVQGKGWSYGVEFMIRKNTGKTTGWLAYTWSNSWRQFEGISFNQKYPFKYDRRHDISLVVMHKFNERIDLSGSWVFGTGNAMSLSTEKYISNFALEAHSETDIGQKSHIQLYETRNNYRMPDYHRMDIGINFHKEKKRYIRTWSLGAYNVYNRKNALWIYWDDSEQNTDKMGLFQASLFQIVPYFSYSFKF